VARSRSHKEWRKTLTNGPNTDHRQFVCEVFDGLNAAGNLRFKYVITQRTARLNNGSTT